MKRLISPQGVAPLDILIVFSLVLGLLVVFGAGAMIWGERRLARSTALHRSS